MGFRKGAGRQTDRTHARAYVQTDIDSERKSVDYCGRKDGWMEKGEKEKEIFHVCNVRSYVLQSKLIKKRKDHHAVRRRRRMP